MPGRPYRSSDAAALRLATIAAACIALAVLVAYVGLRATDINFYRQPAWLWVSVVLLSLWLTHMFRRAASGFFLAIFCVLAPVREAHAQGGVDPPEADPTHYWSYRLSPSFFFSSVIEVKDPFFPGYTTVFLDSLQRVANWVVKDAAALPDTTKRLTWWNIRNKLPNQSSGIVRNQRGGSFRLL